MLCGLYSSCSGVGFCLIQLLKKSRFVSWILLKYSTRKHVRCRQEKDNDETDESRRLLADLPDELIKHE